MQKCSLALGFGNSMAFRTACAILLPSSPVTWTSVISTSPRSARSVLLSIGHDLTADCENHSGPAQSREESKSGGADGARPSSSAPWNGYTNVFGFFSWRFRPCSWARQSRTGHVPTAISAETTIIAGCPRRLHTRIGGGCSHGAGQPTPLHLGCPVLEEWANLVVRAKRPHVAVAKANVAETRVARLNVVQTAAICPIPR